MRNTTEAINVLAASLPDGTRVLSSTAEHHANMLPWRRHDVRLLPFTRSPDELIEATERALRAERIDLVAVTGASNVTGEVWPVAELARLAHEHGAELFVDAAQLAPHRAIDMARAGIDHLALSGHKLYAPFGSGALVGRLRERRAAARGRRRHQARHRRRRHLGARPGPLRGRLAQHGRRDRAGRRLPQPDELGMDTVAAHERSLAVRMWTALGRVPGLEMLTQWAPGSVDRVGVATFNLARYRDPLLAAILSAEHAIGVRHGCFCAHPLMTHLLGVPDGEAERFHAELRAGRSPQLPAPCAPASGSGPPRRTSTGSSAPCTRSPATARARATSTCPSTTNTAPSSPQPLRILHGEPSSGDDRTMASTLTEQLTDGRLRRGRPAGAAAGAGDDGRGQPRRLDGRHRARAQPADPRRRPDLRRTAEADAQLPRVDVIAGTSAAD